MSFQKGGQRRTMESICGWRCVGHPTEVNKKYLIHKKYCNKCKIAMEEIPEWNKEQGLMNGWNGLGYKGQLVNKRMTTAFVNGERKDIILDGISSLDDAMDNTILSLFLGQQEETPVLTKSQKKRLMKKNKKVKEELKEDEKETNDITEIFNIIKGKYETEPREPDGTEIERDGVIFIKKGCCLVEKSLID